MNARVVTSLDEFAELEEDWHRLAKPRKNPLFSFEWHLSCVKQFASKQSLHTIVHANSDGQVDAIAPLAKSQRDGADVIEYLGAPVLYEPTGLLYSSKIGLAALYDAIQRLKIPVVLDRIWAGTDEYLPATGIAGFRGVWVNRGCAGSSVQKVPSNWDSYLESLSPSRRQGLGRKSRQFGRLGRPSLVVEIPSEEDVQNVLDAVYEIEDSSWKGEQGSSVLSNSVLRSFLDDFGRQVASRGELYAVFLCVDDRPIATELHIFQYGCLWELKIGYRSEYQRSSPGQLIKHELTRYCIEKGIRRIEHLGSFDSWQEPWSQEIRDYRTLAFFPFSLRGLQALTSAVFTFLPRKLGVTRDRSD